MVSDLASLKPDGTIALRVYALFGTRKGKRVDAALAAAGFAGVRLLDLDQNFCALALKP